MADHLHPGHLAQPHITGQVGVGGRQVGAVVVEAGIPVVTPFWLEQQRHLAELETGHGEPLARQAGIRLRRAPALLQTRSPLLGKGGVPGLVGGQGQVGQGPAVLAFRVVGLALQQPLN